MGMDDGASFATPTTVAGKIAVGVGENDLSANLFVKTMKTCDEEGEDTPKKDEGEDGEDLAATAYSDFIRSVAFTPSIPMESTVVRSGVDDCKLLCYTTTSILIL